MMYMDYRRRTWNEPERTDRYLMALRAEVRLSNAEKGATVSMEEMKLQPLKWTQVAVEPYRLADEGEASETAEEEELTADEKTARILAGLTAMFGKPRIAGEEKSPHVRQALGLDA